MWRSGVFLRAAVLVSAAQAGAQQADEREAVMAPIRQLFDGMRQHDSVAVQSAFAPEGRLLSVDARSGSVVLRVIRPEQFAGAVGRAQGAAWDEPIYDPEIRIDGDLAMVWARYDFLLGTTWSHCGVDAFMLAKLADGWKITQIADTRQQTGCTTPAAPKP
jgi:hypothetical protein